MTRIVVRRAKFEGGEGKKGEKDVPERDHAGHSNRFAHRDPLRSSSSRFAPLALSLSAFQSPARAVSVLGTITPWGVCIRLRLARGTSTASGAAQLCLHSFFCS